MIHYMPFTYLSSELIGRLTDLLGPVTICLPTKELLSEQMRTAVESGLLIRQSIEEIDEEQLAHAISSFSAWADLHQGKSGDRTGFFRTAQWQGTGRKEADAHQISTQLRHWADGAHPRPNDTLFEAALFLSLAHMYDRQQDQLNEDLVSLGALETQFSRIVGEQDAPETPLGPALSPFAGDRVVDRGLYMTGQRIQSWARLALSLGLNDHAIVTTSRAVWEHLLDSFPKAIPVLRHPFEKTATTSGPGATAAAGHLASAITAISRDAEIRPLPPAQEGNAANAQVPTLTLYALAGCSPRQTLSRLAHKRPNAADGAPDNPKVLHTIVGYLAMV